MSIDERIADRISVLCSARSSNAHEYDLCVRAVRAALADPVIRGWRPIESAPRDGTIFLAINARGNMTGFNHRFVYSDKLPEGSEKWAEDAGWREVGKDWPSYPTHWMPLPEPPEGK